MKLTLNNQELILADYGVLAEGACEFAEFTAAVSGHWRDFSITIRFRHASDSKTYEVANVIPGGVYYIPAEVMSRGTVLVSALGVCGSHRISTTNTASFLVGQSLSGGEVPRVTDNAYAQYVGAVMEQTRLVRETKEEIGQIRAQTEQIREQTKDISEQANAYRLETFQIKNQTTAVKEAADGIFRDTRDVYDDAVLLREEYQQAETERKAEEQARQSGETQRLRNETARQNSETERANAELQRISLEEARVVSESNRASSESARRNAENQRAADELKRKSKETDRIGAEDIRKTAEAGRAQQENIRIAAESLRSGNETGRVAAEGDRAGAETQRKSAELLRENAESARMAAEMARNTGEAERSNLANGYVGMAQTLRDEVFSIVTGFDVYSETKKSELTNHTGSKKSELSAYTESLTEQLEDFVNGEVVGGQTVGGLKNEMAAYSADLADDLLQIREQAQQAQDSAESAAAEANALLQNVYRKRQGDTRYAKVLLGSKSGTHLCLEDSDDSEIRALSLYGASVMSGTPSMTSAAELIPAGNMTLHVYGKNLFSQSWENGAIGETGEPSDSDYAVRTTAGEIPPVRPLKLLLSSQKIISLVFVHYYTSAGGFLSSEHFSIGGTSVSVSLTVPQNAQQYRIVLRNPSLQLKDTFPENTRIVCGNNTSFSAFSAPSWITVPYPLQAIPNRAQTGYAKRDELRIIEGKAELARYVREVTLNGTEGGYGISPGGGNEESTLFYLSSAALLNATGASEVVCNYLPMKPTAGINAGTETSVISGEKYPEVYFRFRKETGILTVEQLKNWIASKTAGGTPLKLWIGRAEPAVTDLTATSCGQALLALKTRYPVCNLYLESEPAGSFSIQYSKSLETVLNDITNSILALS